jgi:hypothetical protein
LLTGQIVGDWLPLIPQSFTRTINAVGAFTGALNLAAGSTAAERRNFIAAVEPEKTVLWAFQDSVPVWNGIIWDWPHQSILDNTLPLAASTPESLFQHRVIEDNLSYVNMDVFDIFRALVTYALAKQPNGQMAGLVMSAAESGQIVSIDYDATGLQFVYDAFTSLITSYNFEYSIRPAVNQNGNLYMSLDLGYPTLGLPLASSGLAYNFPGNLIDYAFPRTGSTAADKVIATGSAEAQTTANATPTFEAGIGGWTGGNGAQGTLTVTTAWSYSGTVSLSWHGNGTTANPLAQTENVPILPSTAYSWECEFYSAQGWPNVVLNVVWLNEALNVIGTVSAAAVDLAAATADDQNMTVTSPANAAWAIGQIEMQGTPSSSVVLDCDECEFGTAGSGDETNWQSEPPAGVDMVTLGAGYPLLETTVSLTTVTVTSQAQINAYAQGQLQQLTGTQLTPMLTLGVGQGPGASQIVLGSYAAFNATSVLHPATASGEPGLQINGRVVGWTLNSPGQEAENTALQFGEIEDLSGTIYVPYSGASGIQSGSGS